MENTPEKLRAKAAALLKEANAIEAARQGQQAIGTKAQGQAAAQQPDPVTGFYPKKPKRTRIPPTQICSKVSPAEAEAALKKIGQ